MVKVANYLFGEDDTGELVLRIVKNGLDARQAQAPDDTVFSSEFQGFGRLIFRKNFAVLPGYSGVKIPIPDAPRDPDNPLFLTYGRLSSRSADRLIFTGTNRDIAIWGNQNRNSYWWRPVISQDTEYVYINWNKLTEPADAAFMEYSPQTAAQFKLHSDGDFNDPGASTVELMGWIMAFDMGAP